MADSVLVEMAGGTGKSSGARAKGGGRSRKRRPAAGSRKDPPHKDRPHKAPPVATPPTTRAERGFRGALSGAERPQAPWHPWPLSELLILIGAIGTIVGLQRADHGFSRGAPVLLAGLGAVVLGTLEITWREHRSGFRSHATLLALLVVVVFHTAVILVLSAFGSVPRAVNIGLLVVDVALFAALFRLLRARYADARVRGELSRRAS